MDNPGLVVPAEAVGVGSDKVDGEGTAPGVLPPELSFCVRGPRPPPNVRPRPVG